MRRAYLDGEIADGGENRQHGEEQPGSPVLQGFSQVCEFVPQPAHKPFLVHGTHGTVSSPFFVRLARLGGWKL